MKTLQPQRIESREILRWFTEAARLIKRRLLSFLLIELIFFALLFAILKATASIAAFTPAVLLLALFFGLSAIVLYFIVAELVMSSYAADHSRPIRPMEHVYSLLASQKAFLKMAITALFIGVFFWVVTLTVSAEKDVLTGSERLISAMVAEQNAPWLLECQLAAGFLYFLFLAMFSLRIFFSIPLMLFHELDDKSAQALSHRAIIINIQPMSIVLFFWAFLLLSSMLVTHLLTLVLLPLFGVFIYVAYRHIFLGELQNVPAKAIASNPVGAETLI